MATVEPSNPLRQKVQELDEVHHKLLAAIFDAPMCPPMQLTKVKSLFEKLGGVAKRNERKKCWCFALREQQHHILETAIIYTNKDLDDSELMTVRELLERVGIERTWLSRS